MATLLNANKRSRPAGTSPSNFDMSSAHTATAKTKSVKTASGTTITITAFGGASEVGRSCIVVTYGGKRIMLDCGLHPGFSSLDSLPFFDLIDDVQCASIDLVLVTHFHLDHIGSLPYFLARTKFNGRVFMTHPTKAIYRWILSDYVKVTTVADVVAQGNGTSSSQQISSSRSLFTDADLAASMERIETINFHQRINVDGVVFTAYNAGHVLGAAMFELEIDGVKILYTGDYSREEDRHLAAAEIPTGRKPDILIVESTYGVQIHQPRREREKQFTDLVSGIVLRGGRCLIPVFALGRAQELLLILEEYWQRHHNLLSHVPIYYASSLAERCMTVYQTYIHMMNDRIRAQIKVSNPFKFKYIRNLRKADRLADASPCVVFASPGMLQNGVSRELFEEWAPDPRSGCVLPGYCVEGTLAKRLQSQIDEFEALSGRRLPIKMSVHFVSFSAHADYAQTSEFVKILRPAHVVLVHGDHNEMKRLRDALHKEFGAIMRFHTPRNCQDVFLEFDRQVKAVMHADASLLITPSSFINTFSTTSLKNDFDTTGVVEEEEHQHQLQLQHQHEQGISDLDQAQNDMEGKSDVKTSKTPYTEEQSLVEYNGCTIDGLIVRTPESFTQTIVSAAAIHTLTPLRATTIEQSISIPYFSSPSLLRFYLENVFGPANLVFDDRNADLPIRLYGSLYLSMETENLLRLEYPADPRNDLLADTLISTILYIEANPASVAVVGQKCSHHTTLKKSATTDQLQQPLDETPVLLEYLDEVLEFFNEHFDRVTENVLNDTTSPSLTIETDSASAKINLLDRSVICDNPQLKTRIEGLVKHIASIYTSSYI